MRDRAGFGLWCVALAVTLWALHLLGSTGLATPPPPWAWEEWLGRVEPAVAIVSLIRVAAIACAWYLALVTIVGAIGRRSGTAGFVSAVDSVTPAFLRVMLASAGGLTLSAAGLTLALTPLLAGSDEVPVASAATDNVPTQPLAPAVRPLGDPPDRPASATLREIQFELAPIVAPDNVMPTGLSVEEWVVETGDHFWAMAEETLADVLGRQATDTEISQYWASLVHANRDRLKVADNPDLIYPGQVMTLPTIPA